MIENKILMGLNWKGTTEIIWAEINERIYCVVD